MRIIYKTDPRYPHNLQEILGLDMWFSSPDEPTFGIRGDLFPRFGVIIDSGEGRGLIGNPNLDHRKLDIMLHFPRIVLRLHAPDILDRNLDELLLLVSVQKFTERIRTWSILLGGEERLVADTGYLVTRENEGPLYLPVPKKNKEEHILLFIRKGMETTIIGPGPASSNVFQASGLIFLTSHEGEWIRQGKRETLEEEFFRRTVGTI